MPSPPPLVFRPVNNSSTAIELDFDARPPTLVVVADDQERRSVHYSYYSILRVRLFTAVSSQQQIDSIEPDDPRMHATLLGARPESVHLNGNVLCLNFDARDPPCLFGHEGIKRMMLCHSHLLLLQQPRGLMFTATTTSGSNNNINNESWVPTQCRHPFRARYLQAWLDNGGEGGCPLCRGGRGVQV